MGTEGVDEYGIPVIADPVSSSAGKRRAIIEAARAEFLAEGYSAASMDSIASHAKVSKPTLYKHYGNKERLFLAVIGGTLKESYADLAAMPCTMADASDLALALRTFLTRWAHTLLGDDLLALRRLVIGEIDRFPQLGRLWYEITIDTLDRPLVGELEELHRRGLLRVPDPWRAVQQLVAMSVGSLQLIRTMRPDVKPDDQAIADNVAAAVETFLSHHRPT
ncbi:TetR/AcrR family transcriptional regulator [Bailinhaonella thermotolerans]|uniref:TetR/AcrR family transcriptional regulator n=1 Tax=Bailinhaonella thermotolerans TaxID=1070861 RepID=A0A3A4AYX0_9ACTN|nr:TetR/AcrR family transcriptional regulator [Bailinhaonella thermotolerans]RJL35872.1 TetR/AcrR family transcriptional regulator [Bailinhaonella thermotolerans]